MQMLFMAHSGVRYLVLIAVFVAIVYFAYAVVTKKGSERAGRIVGAAMTGLMDLQVLLGILLVVFGIFYPALMGHLFMMLAAVAVAHISMSIGRKSVDTARGNAIRLMGAVLALVLILGGIMAIGRQVFGTGSPTLM